MKNYMDALRAISRKNFIAVAVALVCGLIGTFWGWIDAAGSFGHSQHAGANRLPTQDAAFVLPLHPPAESAPDEELLAELARMRIWEVAALQALPPRKEPMTPPGWKIVGVTTVGDDTSVLLLFDKQSLTETRKVGEELPGGAKILQITQDYLRIALNGQYMKLSVRKQ